MARVNPATVARSAVSRAGDSISRAARLSNPAGNASIACEIAIVAFGRPPDARNVPPSVSTGGPPSSPPAAHSTNRSRRSSMARSGLTSAPRSASWNRARGREVSQRRTVRGNHPSLFRRGPERGSRRLRGNLPGSWRRSRGRPTESFSDLPGAWRGSRSCVHPTYRPAAMGPCCWVR